jgi:ubiquinone/menaquinone biosynthesis C-methylase UbiE
MAMAEASRFWDRMADRYVADPIADQESYQTKLKMTRSYFRPDMEVLEFGAGSGLTALLHAPYVKHIHAIDFSGRMVEIARGNAVAQGTENVTFERADIETLDAPDESFDAVLGLSILHLLKDKDAVIARVFRLLKPGGVLVTSTVCIGDTMAFFKFIAPIGQAVGLLPQLDIMTRAELRESLTRAGFAIEHDWQPAKGKAVFIVAKKAG